MNFLGLLVLLFILNFQNRLLFFHLVNGAQLLNATLVTGCPIIAIHFLLKSYQSERLCFKNFAL